MSLARRVVVLVVAFTMALQCYLAQTHIHSLPRGAGGAFGIATEHSSAPSKAPVDHSPMECPLCQAIVHAGAAVISATPMLDLPLAWVETVRLTSALRPSAVVTAHEWQSRAPPRS
jgi:hypothetical protein